eukprot:3330735-Rhodomonas_salina.1
MPPLCIQAPPSPAKPEEGDRLAGVQRPHHAEEAGGHDEGLGVLKHARKRRRRVLEKRRGQRPRAETPLLARGEEGVEGFEVGEHEEE